MDESSLRLPDTITISQAVDGGDINGDGAIDILVGTETFPFGVSGMAQLFLNGGQGYYSIADSSFFPQRIDYGSVVMLFDIEGDGDLDAFMANANSVTDYIAINTRSGIFNIDWSRLPNDTANALEGDYADIDGDGDIDVCLLGNNQDRFSHRLWMNNGQGFFHDEINRLPALYPLYKYVGFADLNGDMAPDIVTVYYDGYESHPTIFINDGIGYYTDESNSRLPQTENFCRYAAVADIDGDGDFDIILSYASRLGFLINDGNGNFIDESENRGPLYSYIPYDIRAIDADNDGDNDLILGTGGNEIPDLIFINEGTGHFEDQTSIRWPNQANSTRKFFAGDLDGDGDCDIFRVGDGYCRNSIFINTLNSPDSIPPHIMNQTILPAIDSSRGPYPVKLMAKDGISIPYQLSVHVNYSTDGITYQADSMHYTGAYIYYGAIPEVDSGETIYYYYTAKDAWYNTSRVPSNASDSVFSFTYLPGYVGIDEHGEQLPEEISIRAYPNPFNSSTVLSIEGITGAEINIFDISGRKVATLNADGRKAAWDASGFSSGIYFARVNTNNSANSIKLILLK